MDKFTEDACREAIQIASLESFPIKRIMRENAEGYEVLVSGLKSDAVIMCGPHNVPIQIHGLELMTVRNGIYGYNSDTGPFLAYLPWQDLYSMATKLGFRRENDDDPSGWNDPTGRGRPHHLWEMAQMVDANPPWKREAKCQTFDLIDIVGPSLAESVTENCINEFYY